MKLNNYIEERFDAMGLTVPQKFTVCAHLLVSCSAAMGHRPYVVYGGNIYGNICMVLAGATGIGKGQSARFANEIFSGFGEDLAAPLMTSTRMPSMKIFLRGIHAILDAPIRASKGEIRLNHINEEFGSALRSAASSYQSSLELLFCRLVDGNYISETLGRQSIEYPVIHYASIGHIQPDELKRCMREHLINSGFCNRFLWREVPPDMQTPLPRMTQEDKTALADEIKESINFAAAQREVPMNEGAKNLFKNFEEGLKTEISGERDPMKKMLVRFPHHILKVALVLAMLRRENEINEITLQDAIDYVNQTKPTIKQYIIPPARELIQTEIIALIRQATAIAPQALITELLTRWAVKKIKKALEDLVAAGIIKLTPIDSGDGSFPKRYVLCD